MPAPPPISIKPLGLASHPMIKAIIDAHMAGQSSRQISLWCVPPISHSALLRYFARHVDPVLRRADQLQSALDTNKVGNNPFALPPTATTADLPPLQAAKEALVGAQVLAIRENRIAHVQARHRLLNQVIEERGAEMELCESCQRPEDEHPWQDELRGCTRFHAIPGGSTGLIVRKLKATGTEYAVDTGVLSELREMEKHIAIELGQWQEGVNTGSLSVQIVCPWADGAHRPEVRISHDTTIEATDDMFTVLGVVQKNG